MTVVKLENGEQWMYKYLNMSTVKAGKFYKNNNTEGK